MILGIKGVAVGEITGNGTAQSGLGGAAGYGEIALTRADEGAFAIDVSAVFENGFTIAGTSYASTALFVATDGFLTFGTAPIGLPTDPSSQITSPFIAPFLADIDTRLDGEGSESGPIWVDIDPIGDVVSITWQDVGFYRRNADLTNTFQIQLFDRGAAGMDVVLRYEKILWTAGDLQGGWGGNGGNPAFIGYRFAPSGAANTLSASGNEAALLDFPTTLGNTNIAGLWVLNVPQTGPATGGISPAASLGADLLFGGAGADTLSGLAGDDTLLGDLGADLLDGGDGFDWTSYANASAGIYFNFTNLALNTGPAAGDSFVSIEAVIGSAFNDQLIGNAADNGLQGGAGHDHLWGGNGQDSLWGGTGDDTLDGGAGADFLDGGDGFDMASYASGDMFLLDLATPSRNTGAAAGDLLANIEGILGSMGRDTIAGDALANYLSGGAGDDLIFGRDGDDLLTGDAGNDTLDGGAGADQLFGGAGLDFVSYADASTALEVDLLIQSLNSGAAFGDLFYDIEGIIGTEFADTIRGSNGPDWIEGGNGHDYLVGRDGDDEIFGGAGNDTMEGGAGADGFFGGTGTDTVTYANAKRGQVIHMFQPSDGTDLAQGDSFFSIEVVIGSDYPDLIWGDQYRTLLDGGRGDDCLYGGPGNDTLIGGTGQDVLFGDHGDDILEGGASADILEGGLGRDRFLHSGSASDATDWIIDYTSNSGDLLVFTGSGASLDQFTITAAMRARLFVVAENVWVVTHVPTGRELWVLENSNNQITDVDLMINGISYDLL